MPDLPNAPFAPASQPQSQPLPQAPFAQAPTQEKLPSAPFNPSAARPASTKTWGDYSIPSLPAPSSAGMKLLPIIDNLADKYGVPRDVLRTAATMESLSSPDPTGAVSGAGAMGPAQIMPANVDAMKKTNPHFDPHDPTAAFTYMAQTLASNYKHYHNDWSMAAGAYNWGGGNLDRWQQSGSDPSGLPQETRDYMLRIRGAVAQNDGADANATLHNHNTAVAHKTISTVLDLAATHARTAAAIGTGPFEQYPPTPPMSAVQEARMRQAKGVGQAAQAGMNWYQQPAVQGPLEAFGAYMELANPYASAVTGALIQGRHPTEVAGLPQAPTLEYAGGAGADPNKVDPNAPITEGYSPPPLGQFSPQYLTKLAAWHQQYKSYVDKFYAAHGQDSSRLSALHDVVAAALKGPRALQAAEEQYAVSGPGFMQAGGEHDPDSQANVLLRTMLDFAGPNPFKPATLAGKFLVKAASLVPGVTEAAVRATEAGESIRALPFIRRLETQFEPSKWMKFAAKRLGAPPEETLRIIRKYNAAKPSADSAAAHARDVVYGGLTDDQVVEVHRRSETVLNPDLNQPNNPNVPEPKGMSLDERAAIDRGLYMSMTDMKHANALIDKRGTFDPTMYSARKGAYKDRTVPPEVEEFTKYGKPSKRASTGSSTEHKIHPNYDAAKAGGQLRSSYSPPDHLYNYLRTQGARVGMNEALSDLADVGMKRDVTYRFPDGSGIISPKTTKFGTELTARDMAQRVGLRNDRNIARQSAMKEAGIEPARLSGLLRANPEATKRLLAEADRNLKSTTAAGQRVAGKADALTSKVVKRATDQQQKLEGAERASMQASAGGLHGARAEIAKNMDPDAQAAAENYNKLQTSASAAAKDALIGARAGSSEATRAAGTVAAAKLGDHVSEIIYGPRSAMTKRVRTLGDRFIEKKIDRAKADQYQKAFVKALRAQKGKTFDRIERNAVAEQEAQGFETGDKIAQATGLNLPALKPMFAYPAELGTYLKTQGATEAEANAFARVFGGVNTMYRMGIIYNPIRHVFINMPINFLAAGGTPSNLLRAFTSDDPEWEKRLTDAQGNTSVAAHPVFGGSSSLAFDTPLLHVPKTAWKRAADEGPLHQAAAAGLQSVNAIASRAWRLNSHVVFDWGETKMKTSLFRQLVEEEGMSDSEAGKLVGNTFGNSMDINKAGLEGQLHKALLFYPWLKSTIPLMMRSMVTQPQYTWVPYSRARDWNRASQDPRWSTDSESTWYLGEHAGKGVYQSWMGPQKYVDDILSVLDPGSQNASRTQKLVNLANANLKPFPFGVAENTVETYFGQPKEPGPPNFDTLWNTAAPKGVQVSQAAQSYAMKLPFVANVAGGVQGLQTLWQGDPTTLLSLLSLNPYERPAPQVEKAQQHALAKYVSGSQRLETGIRHIQNSPLPPAVKEQRVGMLRDQQMIEYITSRVQAQLIDPNVTDADKKAIRAKLAQMVIPYHLDIKMRAAEAQKAAGQARGQAPQPAQSALPQAPFAGQ